jgi:hypothetical protein
MSGTDPITKDEMMELFGEALPMEAVQLLWNTPPNKTVGDLRAELRAVAAKIDRRTPRLPRHEAFWTFDESFGERAYYFAPSKRAEPPYVTQRRVEAILDVASDGTLAGIELVDGDLPPPPRLSNGE